MKKDLVITIFGATGDLTARKILPALLSLYDKQQITENVQIIAIGRRELNTDSYIKTVNEVLTDKLDEKKLATMLTYYKLELTDKASYAQLKDYILSISKDNTKQLLYLAIGPNLIAEVSKNIHHSGLVEKDNLNQIIIFEKPFGSNLASAKKINKMLWSYFSEKQIYRIDHYLGKEMIQNILTLRFTNQIFEDGWSKKSIKSVTIAVTEKSGILNRAGYYEQSGALKDMVQSHLFQALFLLAMKAPKSYFSEDVKNQKVKVIKKLKYNKNQVLFGQYDGYLNEADVPKNSATETFIYLKLFVKAKAWRGVPFHLITGKKLNKKETLIIIEFKPTKQQQRLKLQQSANKLYIRIAPKDGICLSFNSKVPGLTNEAQEVKFTYDHESSGVGNLPEAYEKLLHDAIGAHKTLFARWDEIEHSWKVVDNIKKHHLQKPYVYKSVQDIKQQIMQISGEEFNEIL